MNILILTGRFGMGHNSVAKAIQEEINILNQDINVNTVDLLEYIYPLTHDLIYKSFSNVVNKYHEIYNMLYKASEKLEVDMKLSGSIINKKLDLLFSDYRPDIIVCTLPLCARTISAYKENRNKEIPLITCVTDISKHVEWIAPNTDYYLVPTEEIKNHLIEHNIEEDRINVVGIPVKREFKTNKRNVYYKKINNKKNILIMGGGLGILPKIDRLMEKLTEYEDVEITIITGKNKKAYDDLKGKYRNTNVIGYTTEVYEYMKRADLIISKSGGITLFESIYTETPMVVMKPFLEQEKFNAIFLEKYGIGKVLWDTKESLADTVISLLSDELTYKKMKNNIEIMKETYMDRSLIEAIRNIFERSVA